MRLVTIVAAACLGFTSWVQGASASTITETVDFTATIFSPVSAIDPRTGSFTITFDPAHIYDNEGSGIVINHIDVQLDAFSGSPIFSFDPISAELDVGISRNGLGLTGGTDDFLLMAFLTPGTASARVAEFFYAQNGDGAFHVSTNVSVSLSSPLPIIARTPTPSSVVMLMTAFSMLSGIAYLRSRNVLQRTLAFTA